MIDTVRARLRPRIAVVAVVLALAGVALTVQGARQEAAAETAEAARAQATGFPDPDPPAGRTGAGSGAGTRTPGSGFGSLRTPDAIPAPATTGPPAARLGGDPRWSVLPRSLPRSLEIPSIGLRSELLHLGLRPDGTVEVPPLTGRAPAGWYRHSVTPGETGPAVLLGHVDSVETGRGVFYRLTDLRRGDEIRVTRDDGGVAVFTVTGLQRYPKDAFPTERVYGPTDAPTLRLVTCGGVYDPAARTYLDNVVVYATAPHVSDDREPDGRPVH